MKHMNCIDKAQPGWHPSSAGELPVKQQTGVLLSSLPFIGPVEVAFVRIFCEGEIYSWWDLN